MRKKQIFFLFLLYFIFFSCTNNTPSITQKNLINNNNDSLIKEQESHVEKIYFNVPSTMRTAYILKKAGANYDASLPLDPSIATEDFISDQQALILGILGSDLNYTIVSNKNQETVFYLNSINVLGEKLGLGNVLNQEMKNRIESNINSKDSMQVLVTDLFWHVEKSLNEDGRSSTSALIIAGGWIEGLYIATQIAKKMPENEKIKSIICQQKFSSKSVLELIKNITYSDYISESIVLPLEEINRSLSTIKTEKEFSDSDLNVDDNNIIVDNAVIKDVCSIIEQIREDITH